MPTLEDHLFGSGPKRILSLDGGGIRGIISLRILERIEQVVGSPLSDYFDLIGGTSTGAIIATGLAHGWPVQRLIDLYDELGSHVFKGSFFRRGVLRAKFATRPLRQALEHQFQNARLGGEELVTGLAIVAKRLDTESPWVLMNNPLGKYFGPRANSDSIPNGRYLLRDVVRASTAAPSFFAPEKLRVSADVVGAFVDGGVSPHNNPALQLLMLACLEGYRLQWGLGKDRLFIVAVGTGSWQARHDVDSLVKANPARNAVTSLLSMMSDASALTETILQWLSDSPLPKKIDSELGTLENDLFGRDPRHDEAWLSYVRYEAPIELTWLQQQLPEAEFDAARVENLRKMDRPQNLEVLSNIGKAAAAAVSGDHFPSAFVPGGSRP